MKKLLISFLLLMSLILLTSCNDKNNGTSGTSDHTHTEKVMAAVPATCTETGLSEGVSCSACQEILKPQQVLPALGHNYSDNVCTVCNHKTTKGLEFSLNSNKKSYAVSGLGTATDTDICIPEIYKGLPVTSIGEQAFSACNTIKSIEIPNSVTSIGNAAFFYCGSLTSVKIPDSVKSIGINAFAYCTSLKNISLPNSITNIDISAFENCSSLQSIEIPSSMTSINDGMFYNCKSLTSVTIPDSVTSIGVSAFSYCTNLKSIKIPSKVKDIKYDTFTACISLKSIEIPGNVKTIGEYAFNKCNSLTNISFQGTKAEWNSISKEHGWNFSTGKYTINCTDGVLSK